MRMRLNMTIVLMALSAFALGQPSWLDKLSEAGREQYVLLKDNTTTKNYKEALAPLQWFLTNAPDVHKNIYIYGITAVKGCLDDQFDPNQVTLLMTLYDNRLQYFDNEPDMLGRKAKDAYKYLINTPDSLIYIQKVMEDAWEHDKAGNLAVGYMHVLTKLHQQAAIDDDSLLNTYLTITQKMDGVIGKQEAGAKKDIENLRSTIDKLLVQTIDVGCDKINEQLAPRLDRATDKNRYAQLIVKLSMLNECTTSPAFYQALEIVNTSSPSAGVSTYLGKVHLQKGEYEKSIRFLDQALLLSNDSTEKSEIFLTMALAVSKSGNKAGARKYIFKSLSYNPANIEGYRLLGDLYFLSFEECKQGVSRVEDRLVYLAAYDMYQKANDQKKMKQAASQFPTMENIHTENYEEGQILSCDCWINKEVVLKRRVD